MATVVPLDQSEASDSVRSTSSDFKIVQAGSSRGFLCRYVTALLKSCACCHKEDEVLTWWINRYERRLDGVYAICDATEFPLEVVNLIANMLARFKPVADHCYFDKREMKFAKGLSDFRKIDRSVVDCKLGVNQRATLIKFAGQREMSRTLHRNGVMIVYDRSESERHFVEVVKPKGDPRVFMDKVNLVASLKCKGVARIWHSYQAGGDENLVRAVVALSKKTFEDLKPEHRLRGDILAKRKVNAIWCASLTLVALHKLGIAHCGIIPSAIRIAESIELSDLWNCVDVRKYQEEYAKLVNEEMEGFEEHLEAEQFYPREIVGSDPHEINPKLSKLYQKIEQLEVGAATSEYTPPEWTKWRYIDVKSDVFALGMILKKADLKHLACPDDVKAILVDLEERSTVEDYRLRPTMETFSVVMEKIFRTSR